jgi:exodeoxyribonuclease I
MPATYFFYDLETSGVSARKDRIMQFAGQRTDENLQPIGEPYNILVKMADDILPDPGAIMITGITPQQTLQDGITEAEFCMFFMEEIVQPDTCFVGFNTIRFDDEFMRYILYRNYYDPYGWQWKNGCSRWDLLDVTRMTRALRPDDIKWPVDDEGRPTNRLELITKQNGLLHEAAHDALSDVYATIAVAKLVRDKQPKLYDYLYSIRNKRKVSELLGKDQPFVYTSGRYPGDYLKTTIAYNLGPHPSKQSVFVFNLRHDPSEFLNMSAQELAQVWQYNPDPNAKRLPVKAMQINRAPSVAPLNVLNEDDIDRLDLDMDSVKGNFNLLKGNKDFYEKIRDAADILNADRAKQDKVFEELETPDTQLYDKFISDDDRYVCNEIVNASPDAISSIAVRFNDARLKALLPLYKARNYPKHLTDDERKEWEDHRVRMLMSGGSNSAMAEYGKKLQDLADAGDEKQQYLLEELRLYAESIVPEI